MERKEEREEEKGEQAVAEMKYLHKKKKKAYELLSITPVINKYSVIKYQ